MTSIQKLTHAACPISLKSGMKDVCALTPPDTQHQRDCIHLLGQLWHLAVFTVPSPTSCHWPKQDSKFEININGALFNKILDFKFLFWSHLPVGERLIYIYIYLLERASSFNFKVSHTQSPNYAWSTTAYSNLSPVQAHNSIQNICNDTLAAKTISDNQIRSVWNQKWI